MPGRCTITVVLTAAALELHISDDGAGIPDQRHAGVGLTTMRERAEELGGTCTVARAPGGGTQVRAAPPLSH